MMRKLSIVYGKCGLKIKYTITKYLVIAGQAHDLTIHGEVIKACENYNISSRQCLPTISVLS